MKSHTALPQPRTPRLQERHKVGLVLVLCFLVAWLDRMAINLTVPQMAAELDLGVRQVGWVLSAFFLGYALLQIPGGLLADRWGPRRVMLVALCWWSVFTALTGLCVTLDQLLLARFLFGIGEGVFPACVWKVISGWFTRKNRATANSLVLSTIAIGPALTPLLLAPILAQYGWRVCFFALGGLGLACVFLAARHVTDGFFSSPRVSAAERAAYAAEAASSEATSEAALDGVGFRELLRAPILWLLFVNGLVMTTGMYGWLNWLPSYFMKVRGLDLGTTAWAASLPFLAGTVGCMASGWISDRWFRGRRKLLVVICQLSGALALQAFTMVDRVVTFTLVQSLAGLLLFMANGAIWSLPMVLVPPQLMGAGSGFINTGGQIGGFLANLVIAYYIAHRGGDYAVGFHVIIGCIVLSAFIVLLGVRERPGAMAMAPAAEPANVPRLEPALARAGWLHRFLLRR
jgi:sugar phosphate permease